MYKITATIWDWNVNYLPFLHLSREQELMVREREVFSVYTNT